MGPSVRSYRRSKPADLSRTFPGEAKYAICSSCYRADSKVPPTAAATTILRSTISSFIQQSVSCISVPSSTITTFVCSTSRTKRQSLYDGTTFPFTVSTWPNVSSGYVANPYNTSTHSRCFSAAAHSGPRTSDCFSAFSAHRICKCSQCVCFCCRGAYGATGSASTGLSKPNADANATNTTHRSIRRRATAFWIIDVMQPRK